MQYKFAVNSGTLGTIKTGYLFLESPDRILDLCDLLNEPKTEDDIQATINAQLKVLRRRKKISEPCIV